MGAAQSGSLTRDLSLPGEPKSLPARRLRLSAIEGGSADKSNLGCGGCGASGARPVSLAAGGGGFLAAGGTGGAAGGVGAFATLTDVSFDDFGEGSFDKGLRFSVPLEYFIGTPSKRVYRSTIRPLTRDGGARLDVEGRLYETVRGFHANDLEGNWGRFWR